MSLVKVKKFAQVTIPSDIRQKAHIEEGDYVEVEYRDNKIILTPKRITDKSASWGEKFDKALAGIRRNAGKAGITEKDIDISVRSVRKKSG